MTGVGDGDMFTLGDTIPAADCDTVEATSGIATATQLSVSGPNVNGVGDVTVTCSAATDFAGNTGDPASITYHINYGVGSGILQPINPDNTSIFKRGQTVPVKFKLPGDEYFGFDTSGWSILRQNVSCAAFDTLDAQPESVPSNTPATSFRYDAVADQYIYNADMRTTTVSGCYKFNVTLDSGQVLSSAVFKMAK